ncbi:MAG: regulatory iron-sulfur-containing complex subunit RicT [bacterium]
MYQKKDLEKTFKKVVDFHQIPTVLAQVVAKEDSGFIFFIEETGKDIDTKKIAKSLEDQLGIKAEVEFLGCREKAQNIGGCGPCGRELCCASWLYTIPPVSNECLKGKDFSDSSEYLGMCGKLRCCLAFLDDNFKLPAQPRREKKEGVVEKPKTEEKKAAPKEKKKAKKMVRTLILKKGRGGKSPPL